MKKMKKSMNDTSKTGEDGGGIINDDETNTVKAKAVGTKKKPTTKDASDAYIE